jgi:hypothetical protein
LRFNGNAKNDFLSRVNRYGRFLSPRDDVLWTGGKMLLPSVL